MTLTDLLSRTLAHPWANTLAKWALASGHLSTNATRNYLYYVLGETHFHTGNYQTANKYYSLVSSGPRLPEARRMADWTAHKLGHYEIGWPRYPVAVFEPRPLANAPIVLEPVFVRNYTQPHELIETLNLTPWTAENSGKRNTLVWFNFKDSLGGELFTARAVETLAMKQFGPRPVLATDSRLVDLLTWEFPNASVVAKDANLSAFRGQIDHYFLARDAVKLALAQTDGLERLSALTFELDRRSAPEIAQSRTYIIAWKTTNRRQGRYRNIPLKPFAEALAETEHNYVSAQHGVTKDEERLLKDILGDRITFDAIDTASDVKTFATALNEFDGIVSVDNSLIHIAGCFGLPAVVLLSVPSYWAWPSSGKGSRWYRTVHAIHQKEPKDWRPVLSDLTTLLDTKRGKPFSLDVNRALVQ